jgi:hypothetical protein
MEISEEVVNEIPDCEGVEPTDLTEPLFNTVDPDALNNIFQSFDNGPVREMGQIEFWYYGYKIVVTADGDVSVHNIN